MMKILPMVASELIEIALSDLRTVEDMPDRYVVNMGDWHTPFWGAGCVVCLAGAVMAISLKVPHYKNVFPSSVPSNSIQLQALEALRSGLVRQALEYLGVYDPPVKDREIVCYTHESRSRFHSEMRALAKELKENGL